jgi:DnaJ-domain-containing protein 1
MSRFRNDNPRLEVQGQMLALHSPYNAAFVADLKTELPYTARKWDGTQKVWMIDPSEGRKVRDLVLRHYGINIDVPTFTAPSSPETRLLKITYIGSAKDRGDGTKSAFGWMDGWTVLFPLRVLRDWFEPDNDVEQPTQQSTLYAVLGVRRIIPGANLRKAYRRAARQWHPDVCSEPDATQQFQRIQHAYEVLSDPAKRARYDAGLKLEASLSASAKPFIAAHQWRPPLRCGWLLVEGRDVVGRFNVSRLLQWEDITDGNGRVLVTSWRYGDDAPSERWV